MKILKTGTVCERRCIRLTLFSLETLANAFAQPINFPLQVTCLAHMTVWSCGANPVADRFFQVAKYNTYGNYSTLLYVNQGGDLHAAGNVYANGVQLTSDRNAKAGFTRISPGSVLPKVVALPIPEWNYKTDIAEQKHIGPMAQDFYAAFGLNGADNKHISVVDEGGVALAAIQGLNEKVEARSHRAEAGIQKSETEIQKLNAQNPELKARLAKIEAPLNHKRNGGSL